MRRARLLCPQLLQMLADQQQATLALDQLQQVSVLSKVVIDIC